MFGLLNWPQEVLMGRADYFESFKQNADEFICSLLPGISHPQVQYSPGTIHTSLSYIFGFTKSKKKKEKKP